MAEKNYSIGYKFTGDAAGFTRTMDEMNRSVGGITQKIESFAKGFLTGAGAVLAAQKAWEGYQKVMNTTEGSADKLEEQMAYLHGTVQGVMITLFSGDWGNLITNINDTAEATRNLVKAEDELAEAKARNLLTRGDLEIQLQAAKLLAAEETDKGKKKGYLEEAIGYQRKITALNLSELQQRARAYEDYYTSLSGADHDYRNNFESNVVNIAKNYDLWSGKSQQLSMWQENLAEATKRWWESPNPAVLKEMQTANEKIATLKEEVKLYEDYVKLQDVLSKKGQWEQFLGILGAIKTETAAGDAEILRMTKQITTLIAALKKLKKEQQPSTPDADPSKSSAGHLYTGFLSQSSKEGIQPYGGNTLDNDQWIQELKDVTEEVNNMTSAFDRLGYAIRQSSKDGSTSFSEAMNIISLSAESAIAILGALAAANIISKEVEEKGLYGILTAVAGLASLAAVWSSYVSPEEYAEGGIAYGRTSAIIGEYAGASSNPEVVAPLSKLRGMLGGNTMKVLVEGKFKDREIYLATKSYAMVLNENT